MSHPKRIGAGFAAIALWLAVTAPVFAACVPAEAKSSVSFGKMIEPMLHDLCTTCHISGDAPEGLNLEMNKSYGCQSALNSFQVTASNSFHFVIPI